MAISIVTQQMLDLSVTGDSTEDLFTCGKFTFVSAAMLITYNGEMVGKKKLSTFLKLYISKKGFRRYLKATCKKLVRQVNISVTTTLAPYKSGKEQKLKWQPFVSYIKRKNFGDEQVICFSIYYSAIPFFF